MNFLSLLIHRICLICILAWYYGAQMHSRWQLRGAAFRGAGAEAGRRGCNGDTDSIPFLQSSRSKFEAVGLQWSANCFRRKDFWSSRTDNHNHARQDAKEQLARAEASEPRLAEAVHVARERLQNRWGVIPHVNPFHRELFWAIQFVFWLGETAVNYVALESAGQSVFATWLMAGFVSLIVVLVAHRVGQLRGQGRSALGWMIAIGAMIAVLAKIRQAPIVSYVNSVRSSVPELASVTVEPVFYLALFFGIQCFLFILACHFAAQHFEPFHADYRAAKMAERRTKRQIDRLHVTIGRHASRQAAIQSRLQRYAVRCANDWAEYQNFFEQRVHLFFEGVDASRFGPPVRFSALLVPEPPIMVWVREQLGKPQHKPLLLPVRGKEFLQ